MKAKDRHKFDSPIPNGKVYNPREQRLLDEENKMLKNARGLRRRYHKKLSQDTSIVLVMITDDYPEINDFDKTKCGLIDMASKNANEYVETVNEITKWVKECKLSFVNHFRHEQYHVWQFKKEDDATWFNVYWGGGDAKI